MQTWCRQRLGARARGVLVGASLAGLGALGCERPADPVPVAAAPSAPVKPSAAAPPKATPSAPEPKPSDETAEPPEQASAASSRWLVDEVADVGPAGPATASAEGVVMVDREGQLAVGRLGKLPTTKDPAPTPVAAIDAPRERFFAAGVGAAVAGKVAYYVHGGKLVRRELGAPEREQVLAADARNGTRAVAVEVPGKAGLTAVAYVAQLGERPVARLWVPNHPIETLSPEGAAASSVAMAARGEELVVVALEGRSGMSPVHARLVRFPGGTPTPSEDQVVWVGGGAQRLTEVSVGTSDTDAWGFVPIEQDTMHFGLARIHLGREPRTAAPVSWREYPNGLDPAPVATARLCGEPVVLYARPSDPKPRAPQELHLAAVTPAGLSDSQKVAFAGAFTNASVAPIDGGALVAFVGDGRTWAVSVRCRKGPPPAGTPPR